MSKRLSSVDEIVQTTPFPHLPIFCIRPNTLISTAKVFVSSFKMGDVLYAVKCNSEKEILNGLWEGGVRHFDCASVKECQIIRTLFGTTAGVHFLHPIKASEDIREAYTTYSVKTFAIDCATELDKILNVVKENISDLTLVIRLDIPSYSKSETSGDNEIHVLYPLSGKFGVEGVHEAAKLLQLARPHVQTLGVSFHVGSQCTNPMIYTEALDHIHNVLTAAEVPIEIIDVGGGFPIRYEHQVTFPSLQKYIDTIECGFRALPQVFTANACLWCEPGRALVAACGSLVIRVEERRLKSGIPILYVNDGAFQHLQDALPVVKWQFPIRLLRPSTAELKSFAFFGSTCDAMDYMPGPFLLPSDVHPGDHIEVGQLGAYSTCFRTSFNGCDRFMTEFVSDGPMLLTPGYTDDFDRPNESA